MKKSFYTALGKLSSIPMITNFELIFQRTSKLFQFSAIEKEEP